jgi:hypothetical protein
MNIKKMTKYQKRKLDKLWSEKVKENADFECEICGEKRYLNAHHYIGRRSISTRWWIPNGIALCPKHHTLGMESAHQHPEWFRSEILKIKGVLWLKELTKRWQQISKPEYETVKNYLEYGKKY